MGGSGVYFSVRIPSAIVYSSPSWQSVGFLVRTGAGGFLQRSLGRKVGNPTQDLLVAKVDVRPGVWLCMHLGGLRPIHFGPRPAQKS